MWSEGKGRESGMKEGRKTYGKSEIEREREKAEGDVEGQKIRRERRRMK